MSNPTDVTGFTEVIFFPFKFKLGDKPHNVTPVSWADVDRQLGASESKWKRGEAPLAAVEFPRGGLKTRNAQWVKIWGERQRYQTYAYFHPAIRALLFDTEQYENDYMRVYHRDDIEHLLVTPTPGWGENRSLVTLDVLRCELCIFRMNIAILQIELRSANDISLTVVHQLMDQLRRVYPPYFGDCSEGGVQMYGHYPIAVTLFGLDRCYPHVRENWIEKQFERKSSNGNESLVSRSPDAFSIAAHWRVLLAPFLCEHAVKDPTNSRLRMALLSDDRLPIMCFLPVKDPRFISRGNWIRTALADGPGNDELPYAASFLGDFDARHFYDRFWLQRTESTDKPSRIMNAGYAWSWVGYENDSSFFTNDENGAYTIFRNKYVRLGLLAHLQKACLEASIANISALSERNPTSNPVPMNYAEKKEDIERLYREFIEFSHVYWFHEVTPQLQGRELFEQWQAQLNTQKLYDEVRQEFTDLIAQVNSESMARQAQSTDKLTKYAVAFGVMSVAVATLALAFNDTVIGAIAGLAGNSPVDMQTNGDVAKQAVEEALKKISAEASKASLSKQQYFTKGLVTVAAVTGLLALVAIAGAVIVRLLNPLMKLGGRTQR